MTAEELQRYELLRTMLTLGHETSEDLGLVQSGDSAISLGEESITERNLLALSRANVAVGTAVHLRTSPIIRIESFGKRKEARNGADWEWWIIGRCHTLKMRVQAKRVDKAGGVPHLFYKSKGRHKTQMEYLICDAVRNRLLPVYCFYSADKWQGRWSMADRPRIAPDVRPFEYGCLLASAHAICRQIRHQGKSSDFSCYEPLTVPWHAIVSPTHHSKHQLAMALAEQSLMWLMMLVGEKLLFQEDGMMDRPDWLPSIDQLNSRDWRPDGKQGVGPSDEVYDAVPQLAAEEKKHRLARGLVGRVVINFRQLKITAD